MSIIICINGRRSIDYILCPCDSEARGRVFHLSLSKHQGQTLQLPHTRTQHHETGDSELSQTVRQQTRPRYLFDYSGKIVSKDNKPAIEYLTFKEALTRAHHLGSGIIQQNMFNVPEGETMKLLGIFSKNRVEWGLTDMACLLFGITTIPLYDTLGD
jgi:long-subunit acyl-CoA synthetase (AMP-forming)